MIASLMLEFGQLLNLDNTHALHAKIAAQAQHVKQTSTPELLSGTGTTQYHGPEWLRYHSRQGQGVDARGVRRGSFV